MVRESTTAFSAASAVSTAEQRTEAARHLLARAAHEPVELVVLTGMDLCVLGAPKQVLCEEKLAAAWLGQSARRRRKAMELTTESLARRGLLRARGSRPQDAGAEPDTETGTGTDTYAMDPALGLVLAARSRPGFVVVTALGTAEARTPRMYALGDESGALDTAPVVVVELPESAPPGHGAGLARMGVLGRLYRYVLVARDTAADWLAEWADQPAPESARAKDGHLPARLVSAYRHDEGRDFRGFTVAFRHDGTRAHLLRDGAEDGDAVGAYDREDVRGIMRDLLVMGR